MASNFDDTACTFNQPSDAAKDLGLSLAACHRAEHYEQMSDAENGHCADRSCFAKDSYKSLPAWDTSPSGILKQCGAVVPSNSDGTSARSRQSLLNALTSAPAPRGTPLLRKIFYHGLTLAEASEVRKARGPDGDW
jgi:hypothetical protein